MIPNMESIRNEVREAFRGGADRACVYAERTIAILEDIADSVNAEEWVEERKPWRGDLPADQVQSAWQVPTTAETALETISVMGACTIVVTVDGRFFAAKAFAGADTFAPFPGLVLPRGGEVGVMATTNAAPMPCRLQFKLRRRKPPRRGRSGVDAPVMGVPRGALEGHRHDVPRTATPSRNGA